MRINKKNYLFNTLKMFSDFRTSLVIIALVLFAIICYLVKQTRPDEGAPSAKIWTKIDSNVDLANCIYKCRDDISCIANC